MSELKNRIDFVYIFDVQDGNPNGDPDAGNLPRIDAETGMGIVTDVCLKRKVRNYIQILKQNTPGFDIFIKEKAILNNEIDKAHDQRRNKQKVHDPVCDHAEPSAELERLDNITPEKQNEQRCDGKAEHTDNQIPHPQLRNAVDHDPRGVAEKHGGNGENQQSKCTHVFA